MREAILTLFHESVTGKSDEVLGCFIDVIFRIIIIFAEIT